MIRYEIKKIFSKSLSKVSLVVLLFSLLISCYFAITNVSFLDEQGKSHTGIAAAKSLREEKQKWKGVLDEAALQAVLDEYKKISEEYPIRPGDDSANLYNAKFSSADEVYASIYRQAKVSIYVVDNYIGLRTLVHLKNSQSGVSIILFSDNVGNNKLHNIEFTDFCKEYPNVKISMQKTGEIFHDRFIVLDYGTADERVFLCGASSKDAGARITSIVEDYGTKKYASVMATLLQNPPLVLPK